MTKIEFMNQLEELLRDLPSEEREAALTYYDDYFEDAGPDNTDAVISELGSPERIAAFIKSDLNDNSFKDSEKFIYTENGYKDTTIEEDRYEVVSNDYQEFEEEKSSADSESKTTYSKVTGKDNNNTSKILLIIIICIVAIPLGVPVLGTAFGLIVGILATIFGLFVALVAIAGSFLIGGLVLFIAGVVQLFITPINGILMCGSGLILFGLGTLGAILTMLVCTKVIPVMVRGIVDLCRKLFKKRGTTQ